MNGRTFRITTLVVVCLLTLCAAAGMTFAIWAAGGSTSSDIEGPSVNVPDTTFRYLVLQIDCVVGTSDKSEKGIFYATWDPVSQSFQKDDFYGERYADAYDRIADAEGLDVTAQGAVVIGYTGTLGQYEPIVIPPNCTVGGVSCEIYGIDLMTPEEFPALDLPREFVIPATVRSVGADSFRYCASLERVSYSGDAIPDWAGSLRLPVGVQFVVKSA